MHGGEPMEQQFFSQFGHFATNLLAIVMALLLIALISWAIRKIGWHGPIDMIELLQKWFPFLNSPSSAPISDTLMNVEYRDASGATLDLGPFVKASLQCGCGRSVELHQGYFRNCRPDRLKAGTSCVVCIQSGFLKEKLIVRLDFGRQALFVQSQFTRSEVIGLINRTFSERI
jgi:hypothetical protein